MPRNLKAVPKEQPPAVAPPAICAFHLRMSKTDRPARIAIGCTAETCEAIRTSIDEEALLDAAADLAVSAAQMMRKEIDSDTAARLEAPGLTARCTRDAGHGLVWKREVLGSLLAISNSLCSVRSELRSPHWVPRTRENV